jgi:hypothetical protein
MEMGCSSRRSWALSSFIVFPGKFLLRGTVFQAPEDRTIIGSGGARERRNEENRAPADVRGFELAHRSPTY